MSASPITVSTEDLERELPAARAEVARAGLPAALVRVDSGAFGTTPLNLQALDAVASALASARAAGRLAPDGVPPAWLAFLFAEEAAERLSTLGDCREPPDKAGLPERQYADLANASRDKALSILAEDCARFLGFYREHPDSSRRLGRDSEALACLHSYFRLIARAIRRMVPAEPLAAVQTPRLRLSGWKAAPLSVEEPDGLLDVGFDDIVGNAEMVKAGRRLARDVAGFDLRAGKNPKRVRNNVLFVLGSPGCGKTVTAHAVGRYFLDLCSTSGLPARFRIIRRTDWASSYQNQSANSLLQIFREEVFDFKGVCGAYWPDIDTAFAARGDSEIRQEEKSILGTLFGILDGTVGPKNGKWFLLCDANTTRMDEATLSRLTQSPLKAEGPVAPADFVKLLRDIKLRGKGPWLPLADAEWTAIAERCVAAKLSGRSADSIAGRVLTEIEDFDEPEEYFSLPFAEKEKLIAKLSRPVPAERLLELIEEHVRFEREGQAKAEQSRFIERVKEIRLSLSAQKAALGLPPAGA